MTGSGFPRSGFLLLGVLSLAAAVLFVARMVIVEATGERMASAIAFGVMGMLWLAAYRSERGTGDDS